MRDLMRKSSSTIDDANIANLLEMVGADPSLWGMLDDPIQIKCKQFVESYSPHSIPDDALITALSIDPLRAPINGPASAD